MKDWILQQVYDPSHGGGNEINRPHCDAPCFPGKTSQPISERRNNRRNPVFCLQQYLIFFLRPACKALFCFLRLPVKLSNGGISFLCGAVGTLCRLFHPLKILCDIRQLRISVVYRLNGYLNSKSLSHCHSLLSVILRLFSWRQA